MNYDFKRKPIDLSKFVCIRLRADEHHKSLISGFNSKRNGALAGHLKREAWTEDLDNYRAYYLVREGNKIVLYFSLQCGLLFKCDRKAVSGITHLATEECTEYYLDEDKLDVTKVLPGIELAHFCVNDSYRKQKKGWSITVGVCTYSVGTYIFYSYIAPKVIELASVTGLQYVYLFCADDGDGKLIQHYKSNLNFDEMDDMACIRQKYDRDLPCMTLKISRLIKDTNRFYDMKKVDSILTFVRENGTISVQQANRQLGVSDPQWVFEKMIEAEVVALDIGTPDAPKRIKKAPV